MKRTKKYISLENRSGHFYPCKTLLRLLDKCRFIYISEIYTTRGGLFRGIDGERQEKVFSFRDGTVDSKSRDIRKKDEYLRYAHTKDVSFAIEAETEIIWCTRIKYVFPKHSKERRTLPRGVVFLFANTPLNKGGCASGATRIRETKISTI